mmetsp:Transcript_12574/g.19482  ORF Transcript_12574/g.19482 Transcript_12574/m.19482 type:complete len:114 (+) Transcript_12574:860-1201(+)
MGRAVLNCRPLATTQTTPTTIGQQPTAVDFTIGHRRGPMAAGQSGKAVRESPAAFTVTSTTSGWAANTVGQPPTTADLDVKMERNGGEMTKDGRDPEAATGLIRPVRRLTGPI